VKASQTGQLHRILKQGLWNREVLTGWHEVLPGHRLLASRCCWRGYAGCLQGRNCSYLLKSCWNRAEVMLLLSNLRVLISRHVATECTPQ
jgi:hypothetical protein